MAHGRAPRLESVLHTLAVGALALALARASGPRSALADVEAPSPGPTAVEQRDHPLGDAPLASIASHVLSPGWSGGAGKDGAARPASEPSRPVAGTADFGMPPGPRTSQVAHRLDLTPPRATGPPDASS